MEAPTVGIPFIDYFLGLLADHGYVITAAFAFTENLFLVGSFVPGETIQMAAGFVASSNVLNPWLVWATAFLASFAGGNASYIAGWRGGRPWLERSMRRLHISEKRLVAAEAFFAKHGSETVFLARWVAGIKNLTPAIAGVSRMPIFWFELYSLLGALVYSSLLIAAGYFFGEYLETMIEIVRGSAVGFLGFVLLIAAYARFRVWRSRRRRALVEEITGSLPRVEGESGKERGVDGA